MFWKSCIFSKKTCIGFLRLLDSKLKDKYDITPKYKFASIINDKSVKFLSLNPHLISIKREFHYTGKLFCVGQDKN